MSDDVGMQPIVGSRYFIPATLWPDETASETPHGLGWLAVVRSVKGGQRQRVVSITCDGEKSSVSFRADVFTEQCQQISEPEETETQAGKRSKKNAPHERFADPLERLRETPLEEDGDEESGGTPGGRAKSAGSVGGAPGLWDECMEPPPTTLPVKLRALDIFAGCGGLHMGGTASYGGTPAVDADSKAVGENVGASLSIETVAAVEIEEDPARTYKQAYPSVNVFNMGITRFLATARRLDRLKRGDAGGTGVNVVKGKVVGMRVDTRAAQMREEVRDRVSSRDKQDKDEVTADELAGSAALGWLQFEVAPPDGAPHRWLPERRVSRPSVRSYLNSKLFGAHVFPLPGDVHVVTGGPPCQGWSGFNTQRVISKDIETLLADTENKLLVRFLEIVWFYRPLYVVMEEVPDVARNGKIMEWMAMVYQWKGYEMEYEQNLLTGWYGVPQTRARLIVLATLTGLPTMAMPPPLCAPYAEGQDAIIRAFENTDAAHVLSMLRAPPNATSTHTTSSMSTSAAMPSTSRTPAKIGNTNTIIPSCYKIISPTHGGSIGGGSAANGCCSDAAAASTTATAATVAPRTAQATAAATVATVATADVNHVTSTCDRSISNHVTTDVTSRDDGAATQDETVTTAVTQSVTMSVTSVSAAPQRSMRARVAVDYVHEKVEGTEHEVDSCDKSRRKSRGTSEVESKQRKAWLEKATLRCLVLGDSLSCDLPREAQAFAGMAKDATRMSSHKVRYTCDPPTPYIAYLRSGMPCGAEVGGHVICKLGLSDEMRSRAIPYRKGACWRDAMGDDSVASMLRPMMMELTEEQWTGRGEDESGVDEGGRSCANRWARKVPDYMRQTPRAESTLPASELPPLKHGWTLAPRRFPLVPFWALTAKNGKDHGCYGRAIIDRPHSTVHSVHKPNLHPYFVPWGPRVMSVRDKARIQGFPDHFDFSGDVNSMHRQIGNAVSPQLTKAIVRAVFTSHAAALKQEGHAEYGQVPVFDASLRNFAEYCADLDDTSLPQKTRLTPTPMEPLSLSPMTYEEMLVEYNTAARSDHSCRYDQLPTFDAIEMIDGCREWSPEEVVGLRNTHGHVEACVRYYGYPRALWLDISTMIGAYRNMRQFQQFVKAVGSDRVDIITSILSGRHVGHVGHVHVGGRHVTLDSVHDSAPTFSEDPEDFVKWAPPALVAARRTFDEHKRRYAEDEAAHRFGGGRSLAQLGRVIKKIRLDADDLKRLAALQEETEEEVPGELSRGQKRKVTSRGGSRGRPSQKKVKTPKVQWVVRKKEAAGEENDATSAIRSDELVGARVTVFWDHYGWSEGTITESEGLNCLIKYDDNEPSEKVELPDDTIKILSYPGDQNHVVHSDDNDLNPESDSDLDPNPPPPPPSPPSAHAQGSGRDLHSSRGNHRPARVRVTPA